LTGRKLFPRKKILGWQKMIIGTSRTLLEENERKRLSLGAPLLFCFALFGAWQMGVVYFSGDTLSLDGKTPLPVNTGSLSLLIAAGYGLSLVFIAAVPRKTVLIQRLSAGAALLSALALYLPLPASVLTGVFLFHLFCCVFLIGFETSLVIGLFGAETLFTYIFAAYPLAMIFPAILQNDIAPVPFGLFRIFMVLSTAFLLLFFCKIPAGVWPGYVQKEDGMVRPKKLFAGIYVLTVLGCFMALFGNTAAGNIRHGVMVYYLSFAALGFVVFALWKLFHISPFRLGSALIGLTALGFMLIIASVHVPVLALPACACMSAGYHVCNFQWSYGLALTKRYPSRFIPLAIIATALITVLIHGALVEAFRKNPQILYALYLIIAAGIAVLYLLLEPYLLYSFPADGQSSSGKSLTLEDPAAQKFAAPAARSFETLSARELEVAELMMQGLSYTEIGEKLYIAPSTVISHRRSLYTKMGIGSKRELFALARHIREQQPASPSMAPSVPEQEKRPLVRRPGVEGA
jgi:DNA-binding CsgD family transcriptional regulator